MKKTRENKGITLIALIITIIVMLILVGVSVNVALNGGLFDTAKTAAEKTNEAVQGEKDYMAHMSLIAEADELVKRYPFEGYLEIQRPIELNNANMVHLYKYILEKYGITAENFDLATAIRTANTFYEIYDREIQRVAANDGQRDYFWQTLANPISVEGIHFINYTATAEEINLRSTLQLAFTFSKNSPINSSVNGIAVMDAKINDVRHYVIGNPNVIFDATSTDPTIASINSAYNASFPGGHFPVDAITGTQVSYPDVFDISQGTGEICILTEEIANSISSKNGIVYWITATEILGDEDSEEVNLHDYIGRTICLISMEIQRNVFGYAELNLKMSLLLIQKPEILFI